MSVNIPQPFALDGGIDTHLSGAVDTRLSGSLDSKISGIPDHFTISIDKLPKIQLALDPVELKPVDLSLRLKEIPSIRAHLPADFRVGLSLLGIELLTVRLCGQAMAITEPYKPNPCEVCGGTTVEISNQVPRLTLGGG
jgi:hypothetical protein